MPAFGYKNHVGIDRAHGVIRRSTVTHAAAHATGQLAALLDGDNLASGVWADTAYRSQANLVLLAGSSPSPPNRRSKPMPAHIRRGNSSTSLPPRSAASG